MNTDVREASRRLPAAERRRAIVRAALRVFSSTSFAGATTAEIAREAGVSEPVLYRHFADKAELYLAVAERASQTIVENLIPSINLDDGTPNERIRAMVGGYLGEIERHPRLYRFLASRSAVSFGDNPRSSSSNSRTRNVATRCR